MDREQILLCVPARLASSRLPEKLLADLGGQSVIAHVCDRLREVEAGLREHAESSSRGVSVSSLVLTDSERIAAEVRQKSVEVRLSELPHGSGSSRIRECVLAKCKDSSLSKEALVVNIQGDEPFLEAADVVRLIKEFQSDNAISCLVGTLVHRNSDPEAFLDPSVVKAVRRADGTALYFSRAPVPWPRETLGVRPLCEREREDWSLQPPKGWGFWHHLGIYIYRAVYFLEDQHIPAGPDPLHELEALEQLEVLLAGEQIWISEARAASCGIDTARDLEHARLRLARQQ